ncbi:hypothetical protein T484DRAFT_1749814 [Baffinella frigidus]|nr:hypothetical protein T484DRAFT_1749814 [Cryptophyta sp. CCMP2293]
MNYAALRLLSQSTKTLREQQEDAVVPWGAFRHLPRISDLNEPPADLRQRRLSEPTLKFKVHTVSEPDYAWLDEESAAPVYWKTPIPKRAAPREQETIQGEFFNSLRVGKNAHGPYGLTWEGQVEEIARLLQASQRAETCVWRRGDDA